MVGFIPALRHRWSDVLNRVSLNWKNCVTRLKGKPLKPLNPFLYEFDTHSTNARLKDEVLNRKTNDNQSRPRTNDG